MELDEAMRTQHACRYYRDDPVPDEVLFRAVELARFAPNGGNRCAVRFVFVRDPVLRRRLGEWYLPLWEEVAAAARAGAEAIPGATGPPRSVRTGFSDSARTMADTDQFARRFGEHPVIVVVCADLAHRVPHRGRVSGPPVPHPAAPPRALPAGVHRPVRQPAQPGLTRGQPL